MNFKLTLAAALATGLMCSTAMAQTHSPNPNKAQNSAMRTQSGMYPYALYPDGSPVPGHVMPGGQFVSRTLPATVAVAPLPAVSEPMAGTRSIYVPSETTTVIETTPSLETTTVIESTPLLEPAPTIEVTPVLELEPGMERTSQ
jgi:hypothetical protein